MTDFEQRVLTDLGTIKASIATVTQAQVDSNRRVSELEEHNRTLDTRHWFKSIAVGIAVMVGHPIARKLGLDI